MIAPGSLVLRGGQGCPGSRARARTAWRRPSVVGGRQEVRTDDGGRYRLTICAFMLRGLFTAIVLVVLVTTLLAPVGLRLVFGAPAPSHGPGGTPEVEREAAPSRRASDNRADRGPG